MRRSSDPAWRITSSSLYGARGASGPEESAAAFCEAFEHSSLAVVILDRSARILGVNSTASHWGIGPSGFELTGEREAKEFSDALNGACEGQAGTLWLSQVPGGNTGEFFVEVLPWSFEGLALVVLWKGAHFSLTRQEFERRTRFESLGRLASSVAHDFNNLLTGIRGSLALIRNGGNAQSRSRALDAADAASQRAGEMIRQILAFGRAPCSGSETAQPDLVVQEAVQLVNCIGDTNPIVVTLDARVARVDMPASHLHQVVLNLLMNAHDAVRERGPRGQVSVHANNCSRAPIAGTSRSEQWVQITISDNGEGITPAVRRRIFEPFFSTKSERKGTGLGLSNVKALVERVGGWVEVDSEECVGTTVHVFLPPAAEESMSLGVEDGQSISAAKVLICDDETRLADLTAGLLVDFGYQASAVAEGSEAIEVAQRTGVQVLILDVNLSAGLSAPEVLAALVQRGTQVRVILTSGLALNEVAPALRVHPLVVGYLGKPYTVEELTSGIEAAFNKQRTGA